MLTEEKRRKTIETLQKIIRIPSIGPEEGEVAACLKEIMQNYNFDEVQIDEVGNVIGKITGTDPAKAPVLFDGHIDTMGPSSTPWDTDPFGGEIKDGKIYGRGTSDMKGSIAAAICAAAFLKEEGYRPVRDLYICGSVSEELIEGIALEPVLKRIKPELVIIGEATNLDLAIGQRGRAEIVIETHGVPTHTSRPDLGVNAIKLMHEVMAKVDKIAPPEDPLLGKAIMEITDVKSFPYPGLSMVPDLCKATYDRRLVVGETEESVLAPVREAVKGISASVYLSQAEFDTYTGYKIKAKKFAPAWVQTDKELITNCLKALKTAGINARTTTYQFCTNGSSSAGKLNISTLGFGVGEEEQAHRVNEYVSIDNLLLGTKGYMELFKFLCSQ